MEEGMSKRWYDVFVGREMYVSVKIIARLGPETHTAELVSIAAGAFCLTLTAGCATVSSSFLLYRYATYTMRKCNFGAVMLCVT